MNPEDVISEWSRVMGACPNTAIIRADGKPEMYSRFVASRVTQLGSITLDTLHAAVGVSSEAGELLDAVKKHWAYGQPLDIVNVKEELGDLFFYVTAMMIATGISFTDVLQSNVEKLEKRYPAGYTDAAAKERVDKQGD